jgi:hypothetical protein
MSRIHVLLGELNNESLLKKAAIKHLVKQLFYRIRKDIPDCYSLQQSPKVLAHGYEYIWHVFLYFFKRTVLSGFKLCFDCVCKVNSKL